MEEDVVIEEEVVPKISYEDFCEWLDDKKRDLNTLTRRNYKLAVRQFLATNPDLKKQDSYNMFLVDKTRGKESDTMNKRKNLSYYFTSLKHYVKFLQNEKYLDGYLGRDITDRFPKPITKRDTKRETPTSFKELRNVIEALALDKNKLIADLMILTGARIGTVLNLKRKGVSIHLQADNPHIKIKVLGKNDELFNFFLYDLRFIRDFMWYFVTEVTETGYVFLDDKNPSPIIRSPRRSIEIAEKTYFQYANDYFIFKI